jgi:thioredoxin-related protein
MKKQLLLLFICFISIVIKAQTTTTTITNLQSKATQSQKNIAIYFCGSDWCSVCNNFKKSFLSNPKVDSLLKNNYVYYMADFPQRTKLEKSIVELNEALAEKLNPEGHFPKLVITDEQLKIKVVIFKNEAFETAYLKLENNSKK